MRYLYISLISLLVSLQVYGQSLEGDKRDLIVLPQQELDFSLELVEDLRSETTAIPKEQYYFTSKNRQIDEGRPTVQIPYSINTTPSGAFLSSVPIATIPNAQFAPNISVQYNSQSRGASLGNGWSLSGISSVRWLNTNLFYDQSVEPIEFSDTWQAFSLDGVRLVKAQENKFSAEFTTEQGFTFVSFGVVYSANSFTQYPQVFFKAYYPNGQTAQYSNIVGNQKVHSPFTNAPVQEIRDKLGYTIHFEYETFSRYEVKPPYIKRILYGAKGNEPSPYSLEFEYVEDNSPKPLRRIFGIDYKEDKLLKRIYSKKGSEVFRVYEFSYQYLNKEYFLERIDCSSQGEALNPLLFSYNQEYKNQSPNSFEKGRDSFFWNGLNLKKDNLVYVRGHFSKKSPLAVSGLSDKYNEGLIVYPEFAPYAAVDKCSEGYIYGSKCPKGQKITVYPSLGKGSLEGEPILAEEGFQTLQAVDTDGDGIDELVKVNLRGISGNKTIVQLSKYENIFSEHTKTVASFGIEGVVNYHGKEHQDVHFQKTLWGNFLGDGRTMLLLISPNKTIKGNVVGSKQSLIDLEQLSFVERTEVFTCEFDNLKNIYAIDIDADGKTDICYRKGNVIEVYSYRHKRLQYIKSIHFGEKRTDVELYFADINRDGYIDIVCPPEANAKTWSVYLNLPAYNRPNDLIRQPQEIAQVSEKTKCFFIDVNQDDFIDLLLNEEGLLSLYLNDKGTFQKSPTTSLNLGKNSYCVPLSIVPMSLGYNGGRSSLIVQNDTRLETYTFSEDCSKDKLLYSIYDSFGVLTELRYSNVFKSSISEEKASKDYYLKEKFPLNTLHSIEQYDNRGNIVKDVNYSYFDPTLHRLGLGFCGFEKVYIRDELKREELRRRYNPYLKGVLLEEENYNLETDQAVSRVSYSYNENQGSYTQQEGYIATWNPTVASILTYDCLNHSGSKSSFKYNDFGQATRELKEYNDGNLQLLRTDYHFVYEKDRYILGIPTEVRETNFNTLFDNERPWSNVKQLTYNDDYTLLTGTKTYVGTEGEQLMSEEILEYDNQNRLIIKTTIPHNRAVSLTQYYKYNGDYLSEVIDEKGLRTKYLEYDIYAKPQRVIDVRGNATDYLYDNWGRLLTQTDNNQYTAHKEFWQDGRLVRELYTGQLNEAMQLISRQETDVLGRELKSGAIQFDGSMLWTEKQYNKQGLLLSTSLPYREGSSIQRAGYEYDKYHRLTSVTYPSGRKDEYAYALLAKTSIIDGIKSKKCFNTLGQLVSSEDLGGKISYSYRTDGQPSSIIAPNGAKTLFEYDDCGRLVKLIDPSAGEQITRYTYHDSGYSSIEQENANGTIRAEYNPFGELKFQDFGGDQQVEYLYNKYGDLVQVFSRNGLNKYYRYDSFGRVVEQVQRLRDLTYKELYTYHRNRLVETRYELPNGKTLNETYSYQNEQHTETHLDFNSDSTRLVYQLKEINGQGIPSKVQTGALSRTYEYSHLGLLTKRTISKADELLQEQIYSFNPLNSNLLERSYALGAEKISEHFQYDKLNRLVRENGNSPLSNKDMYYNSSGCITSNGSAGYQYFNSAKPYQLSSIETYSYHKIKDLTENADSQELTYTAFNRPKTIAQGDKIATFSYDEGATRVQMAITNKAGELLDNRYYFGGRYEADKEREIFYVDGNAYTAPAVLIKEEEGDWQLYYIGRDYQGSITELIDEKGNVIEQYAYAPWGRRASLGHSIERISEAAKSKLRRGYTGHEYLPEFGLINMNARLYDPYLGLFLSPDPYVQNPEFSQNFNRYIYCLNNPLKYTDKNGELVWFAPILIGIGVFGFGNLAIHAIEGDIHNFKDGLRYFATGAVAGAIVGASWSLGLASMSGAKLLGGKTIIDGMGFATRGLAKVIGRTIFYSKLVNMASTSLSIIRNPQNGLKILGGRAYFDNLGQALTRYIWEAPQSFLGYNLSQIKNIFGSVDRVDYYGGATFVTNENSSHNRGISLGSYINIDIPDQLKGPFEQELFSRPMFMHEYGHYIDSQKFGLGYSLIIGLPSLITVGSKKMVNINGFQLPYHDTTWYERRANNNAAKYFNKYGVNWSKYVNRHPR